MRKLTFILVGLLLFINVFAQHYGGNRSQMYAIFSKLEPNKGLLIGRVVDRSKKAMPYTTVTLYKSSDSSVVTGTLTDTSGRFVLLNVPYGKYFLEVKFIGFRKKIIKDIVISGKKRVIRIGTIELNEESQQLDEVVVTANSKDIEYKVDKKVINVSKNISTTGGTAVDILQNVPSVEVDIQGNVKLRGSSNFTVFIDGKPSVLEGSEALQQIPASEIQKIEIITNPSAKYDPDGVAGIINVITKRSRKKGYNGNITVTYDNYNSLRANAIFNVRFKKINFFAGFTKNDRIRPADYISNRIISHDSSQTVFETNGTSQFRRGGWNAKTGFNYYLTDKTTLTFTGSVGQRQFDMSTQSFINESASLGKSQLYNIFYKQTGYAQAAGWTYDGSLDLLHKFNNKGHQIRAYVYLSNWMPTKTNGNLVDTTDADWNIISNSEYGQQSIEARTGLKARAQVDYELPLSNKRKFEAGYSGRYSEVTSDYKFYLKSGANDWSEVTNRSNNMDFRRNIQAAYVTYTGNLRNWFNYQVGLRTEFVDRIIEQKVTNEIYPVKRLDFFPSAHISKRFGRTFQVQMGYSRRVNRPNGWFLNPFPMYIDNYTIMKGNPALLPEFGNAYELNFIKNFKNGYFSVESFYRQKINKFERIQTVTDSNVIVRTWTNAGQDRAAGAEISLNLSLLRMLMINASTSFYHYQVLGTLNNEDVNNNTWTWNSRLMIMAMLPTMTRLQVVAFYRAPTVTLQGRREGFVYSSIGLRQDFFKRKLSMTLSVNDPFKLAKFVSITDVEGLYSYNEYIMRSPQISLTMSLRINDYKPRRGKPANAQQDVSEFEGEGLY